MAIAYVTSCCTCHIPHLATYLPLFVYQVFCRASLLLTTTYHILLHYYASSLSHYRPFVIFFRLFIIIIFSLLRHYLPRHFAASSYRRCRCPLRPFHFERCCLRCSSLLRVCRHICRHAISFFSYTACYVCLAFTRLHITLPDMIAHAILPTIYLVTPLPLSLLYVFH